MKKILAILLLSCSPIVFAAPVKTIHFATEATYPPFEYVDESGSIKGFDIDLAKALCAQLKAECTFSNQPFSSLIPSLSAGKFDALISALGITEERKQQVAFTSSYYEPSGSFVAALDRHFTIASLAGSTIGVQTGSTFEKFLQDKYGSKIRVNTYASIQDAFLDLSAGRVDAVLADTPIAHDWLKQDQHASQYGIVEQPIVDAAYFGQGYGIALRKDDTDTQKALDQALAVLKANGTYTAIKHKYFG